MIKQSKYKYESDDDSDDDEDDFIKDLLRILRKEMKAAEMTKVDLVQGFLELIKEGPPPAQSSSDGQMSSSSSDDTMFEMDNIQHEDLRNSCFSGELCGQKFKNMVDKKKPLHRVFWSWVYAIAHLPQLVKYNDILCEDMTAAQIADNRTRQDRIGNLMCTFLYEVCTYFISL